MKSPLMSSIGPTMPTTDTATAVNRTRPALWGAVTGGASYLVLPEVVHMARAGTGDEVMGLGLGLAAALIANAVDSACEPADKARPFIEGGAAGAIGGAALIPLLTTAGLAVPPLGIAAALVATTVAAAGYAAHKNAKTRRAQTKRCEKCKRLGDCPNRVCPYCFAIYYPPKVPESCAGEYLNALSIASLLQQKGLNLLKADVVVTTYLKEVAEGGTDRSVSASLSESLPDEIGYVEATSGELYLRCEPFLSWLAANGRIPAVGRWEVSAEDKRAFLEVLKERQLVRRVPDDIDYRKLPA
ncbi:MAG TPA: hypothetical protein VGO40_20885 [Longimicrobium sp.]|nr:hypothetical protein [Longimicrobium sp.]